METRLYDDQVDLTQITWTPCRHSPQNFEIWVCYFAVYRIIRCGIVADVEFEHVCDKREKVTAILDKHDENKLVLRHN